MKSKKEMTKLLFTIFSIIIIGGTFFLGGIISTIISFVQLTSGSVPASSTAPLSILFGIISSSVLGVIMGVIGAVIGIIIALIIKNPKTKKVATKKALKALIVLFVISAAINFLLVGSVTILQGIYNSQYDEANKFGIKNDSALVTKIPFDKEFVSYNFTRSYDHFISLEELSESYKENKETGTFDELGYKETLRFNGKDYMIGYENNTILVIDSDGNHFIDYEKNPKYPYSLELSYMSYTSKNNNTYLIILDRLRATSDRAVFLVFDESGKKIYEELLENPNLLEVGKTETYGDVIILADEFLSISRKGEIRIYPYFYVIE